MSLAAPSVLSIDVSQDDQRMQRIYEEEESDLIVLDIREELLRRVDNKIYDMYLNDQKYHLVVRSAISALKKIVELHFYYHNDSFFQMDLKGWTPDTSCPPSPADSWAAYRIPIRYSPPPETPAKEDKQEDTKEIEKIEDELKNIWLTRSHQKSMAPSDFSEDPTQLSSLSNTSTDVELIKDEQECRISSELLNLHIPESSKSSTLAHERMSLLIHEESMEIQQREFSDWENLQTVFSKTAMGDYIKDVCPKQPMDQTTVVAEMPHIESNLAPAPKRKEKRSKRSTSYGRSDNKAKILVEVDDEDKDAKKKGRFGPKSA